MSLHLNSCSLLPFVYLLRLIKRIKEVSTSKSSMERKCCLLAQFSIIILEEDDCNDTSKHIFWHFVSAMCWEKHLWRVQILLWSVSFIVWPEAANIFLIILAPNSCPTRLSNPTVKYLTKSNLSREINKILTIQLCFLRIDIFLARIFPQRALKCFTREKIATWRTQNETNKFRKNKFRCGSFLSRFEMFPTSNNELSYKFKNVDWIRNPFSKFEKLVYFRNFLLSGKDNYFCTVTSVDIGRRC